MLRMQCVAQQYDWGKLGADSAVARLKRLGEGTAIDDSKPYAEYWFGTHPSGPSKVHTASGDVKLQDWLLGHPQALGQAPYAADSALPYLLKVLSVAKALSIQAHPDRSLAARLHAEQPDQYKDANHKPEMTCALTYFEAMCGFRPPDEIAVNLSAVPELVSMIGEASATALRAAALAVAAATLVSAEEAAAATDRFKAALRAAFQSFMAQPAAAAALYTAALETRLAASAGVADAVAIAGAAGGPLPSGALSADAVALRLCAQYPGDAGILAPYLLNCVRLAPGDAIFLAANEPHAYLLGDCVEVMATSDNVVRAGLTPKHRDVSTLVEMLTYAAAAPEVLHGEMSSAAAIAGAAHTRVYRAPVPEFELQRTALAPADGLVTLLERGGGGSSLLPSAAVIVVMEGSALATVTTIGATAAADAAGTAVDAPSSPGLAAAAAAAPSTAAPVSQQQRLEAGQVWLQPANARVEVTALPASAGGGGGQFVMFRAHAAAAAAAL